MYQFEFEEDELYAFNSSSMVTKDDLLSNVEWTIKQLESEEGVSLFNRHSAAFRNLYINLFKQFHTVIENTRFFDQLEPWWCYEYEVNESGITLHLQYVDGVTFEDEDTLSSVTVGEDFELVKVSTRLLTVEEYAKIYDVSVGTVRQWIRRGKIRSAVKTGSEWRIPELTEITGRGYSTGYYHWSDTLVNLPEEYAFLEEYSSLFIEQSEADKNQFSVTCYGKEGKHLEKIMETKEREKFELYLISHPLIKASEEALGTWG